MEDTKQLDLSPSLANQPSVITNSREIGECGLSPAKYAWLWAVPETQSDTEEGGSGQTHPEETTRLIDRKWRLGYCGALVDGKCGCEGWVCACVCVGGGRGGGGRESGRGEGEADDHCLFIIFGRRRGTRPRERFVLVLLLTLSLLGKKKCAADVIFFEE